jgi:glycosyltransferase involved in cell wall biosynthesis
MACGIPTVVTDAGDSAAIVGDTGVLVPIRNPPALARGILDLVQVGMEGRNILGHRARERVQREYSQTTAVERYGQLYRELAGRLAD